MLLRIIIIKDISVSNLKEAKMFSIMSVTAASLGGTNHLALKGLRHAILGRPNSHLFVFTQVFGSDAVEASQQLVEFTETIGLAAYRPLQVRPIACGHLTPHELSLLGLIAAAADGDCAREQAHLNWLIRRYAHKKARELTNLIAGLFNSYGLDFKAISTPASVPSWPCPLEICGGTEALPLTKVS